MALQTAFTATIPSGFAGMIANGEIQNRISRTIEDANGIAFGLGAFRGTNDHGITATPSANFLGVVIVDHGQVRRTASVGADLYDQYDNVPIMQRGTVWVNASLAVADGDPVYINPAKAFTNVSNAGANFATGFKWVDTTAGAALARITNNLL